MLRPLLLLLVVGVLNADRVHYDGHTVYRVTPRTEGEFQQLLKYQQYLERNRVDIWRETSGSDSPLDFRVSPDKPEVLKNLNLNASMLIPDVETLIQNTVKSNVKSKDGIFDYSTYHSLSEIDDWMRSTVSQFNTYASLFLVTQSYEGRPLYGLMIRSDARPKPAIWLQAGMHAREWIGPATVIYIANQLLEKNNRDPSVTSLLYDFNVYIVPVVNVDGYEYSWTTDRMWKKTRSITSGSFSCKGVDLNRNWDSHWCGNGGSSDDCSEIYCGSFAFSEEVLKGVSKKIQSISNLVGFIDFYSYSQAWVTPYGFTPQLPEDVMLQNQSSAAAVAAIESVHGTQYKYGSIANTVTVASGTSADWTYEVAGVKYSAEVELRDTGKYGFLLPPDQIIPTGEETLQGVLAYMNFIKNHM